MKFEFEMLFGCQKLVNRVNKLEILSGKKEMKMREGEIEIFEYVTIYIIF